MMSTPFQKISKKNNFSFNKLHNLLSIFFKNKFKVNLYKSYFLKILKFSKNNFCIIKIDYIFYLFKNLEFKDLEKVITILKIFKIKIFEKIPINFLNLLIEKNSKNLGKFNKILKKNNTENLYFLINGYLKSILKKFLNNTTLVSSIFKSNNNTSYYKLISKIIKLKSSLNISVKFSIKKKFFNSIKFDFKKKFLAKNKIIYSVINFKLKKEFSLLNFISKNKIKFNIKNKNSIYKILKNFLNKKIFKFKIKLNLLDYLYRKIEKKNKSLNNIKMSFYDTLSNVVSKKLTINKFNYLFLKHGSNLIWVNNFLKFNIKNNKIFLKIFYKNIKKIKISLKKVEKYYSLKIKNLYKLFNIIELKFLKLNLIKNNIIKSKLKKVKNLIFKNNKELTKIDLTQEAYLSLINSTNNYDINLKSKFDSYVVYNAKKHMSKHRYESCRLIRIPYSVDSNIKKINDFIKYYNRMNNTDPTIKKISEILKIKYIKVIEALNLNKKPLSIEKPLVDTDMDFADIIYMENGLDFDNKIFDYDLDACITELFNNLNNRSLNILKMRYGIELSRKYTLAEVGNVYNLSKERIRQIQKFILQKFKSFVDPEKLINFFNSGYFYYK